MEILNENSKNKGEGEKSVFDDSFLTPREKEILDLICKQLTTHEIGKKLFISPRTVDVHRKNMLEKTGVRNIAGLVIFAMKNHLVPHNFAE